MSWDIKGDCDNVIYILDVKKTICFHRHCSTPKNFRKMTRFERSDVTFKWNVSFIHLSEKVVKGSEGGMERGLQPEVVSVCMWDIRAHSNSK